MHGAFSVPNVFSFAVANANIVFLNAASLVFFSFLYSFLNWPGKPKATHKVGPRNSRHQNRTERNRYVAPVHISSHEKVPLILLMTGPHVAKTERLDVEARRLSANAGPTC